MSYRICAIVVGISLVAVTGAAAQGSGDEPSLRLTHETVVTSVTSANLATLQAIVHPRAAGFFKESQQLVQLGGGVTANDVLPTLIADLGRFVSVPTDTEYRVIGPVGLVNLTAVLQAKKGEKQGDRFVRGTYVYLYDGGGWKLVSWHGSDTPLQRKGK